MGDSRRLLVVWFVKRSFWWMFFGGAAVASVVHFVERVENEFQVNYRSPESVGHGLLSAWAFVVLAVLLRIAIAWIALAAADAKLGQVALDRVSPGPGWWRRLDPIIDVVSVVGVVAFIATGLALTTVSAVDPTQ